MSDEKVDLRTHIKLKTLLAAKDRTGARKLALEETQKKRRDLSAADHEKAVDKALDRAFGGKPLVVVLPERAESLMRHEETNPTPAKKSTWSSFASEPNESARGE